MINRFIFILNNIFSFLVRFFKKIRNNWPRLRKIFVVFVFIIFFMFYLQSPQVKLQISNTAQLTILQYEKTADYYISKNDFDNAIDQYKSAVSIILSQKNVTDISIDKNIQCRICKKSANAFLKYSRNNILNESHKKTGRMFMEGLNLQKKYFESDTSIDYLIKKISLTIT